MSDKHVAPQFIPGVMPYEEYRAQQALAAQQEAAKLEMDETVAGGRYMAGDQVVDAEGKPLKDTHRS